MKFFVFLFSLKIKNYFFLEPCFWIEKWDNYVYVSVRWRILCFFCTGPIFYSVHDFWRGLLRSSWFWDIRYIPPGVPYYWVSPFLWNFEVFWFIFIINLCRQFFCDFRMKGHRSKWTIYKHVSDNSRKCLSVGNSGILSIVVVVCVLAPAYTSLCRGLK